MEPEANTNLKKAEMEKPCMKMFMPSQLSVDHHPKNRCVQWNWWKVYFWSRIQSSDEFVYVDVEILAIWIIRMYSYQGCKLLFLSQD